MTDPIGLNIFRDPLAYQSGATAAPNPLTKEINRQQPASIDESGGISSKSKSAVRLPGEKYRDCKT